MPTSLVHVSDLHVGAHERLEVEASLRALIERVEPELIVATGDLTHRGRRDEHARAATFLRGLGAPVLAVPGNHDIPLLPPPRFTRPWQAFEQEWETTVPVHRSDELLVVGLNSVRPWRHQSGGLHEAPLESAEAALRDAAPGTLRVACLHHQLANAPWRTRKRPLARRGEVLARLAAAGAELVLSGHVHQAGIGERREFAVLDGDPTIIVATAPGLTRPRPHRLGEAQGVHVVRCDEDTITLETHIFDGETFSAVAERRFLRATR